MLSSFSPLKIFTRTVTKRPYKWYGEGIRYPGFTYYPRHPDFKDPPYQPTKLFRVQRIKNLKGNPYWEKNILKEFKLDGERMSDIVILKNTPEINSKLWKVKHLIKITPITFPNGFPDDINGTFLKENGEFLVTKRLVPNAERLEKTEAFRKDPKRIDGDTLRRDSRKKWLLGW